MKKLAEKWQFIVRVIIILVAIGLMITGVYHLSNYFLDHKLEKTQVTALIIQDPKDTNDQLLKYSFEEKTYKEAPRDRFLPHYGNLDEKITVYVETSNPQHVFIQETATGEGTIGSLFLGWGLFLILIAWLERRVLKLLKRAENIDKS
ncbi:MAG: DUF3592 domain-containing protein [Streptococcaceae bacterium]|jgi:hypothetical protein|nr:DUF3592 domain-containing protein [Streptococcaceae bacterium]